MRRLTKVEKQAALAVIAMTAAVAGTGIKLIRRHTRYVVEKAAAFFREDEQGTSDVPESSEASEDGGQE